MRQMTTLVTPRTRQKPGSSVTLDTWTRATCAVSRDERYEGTKYNRRLALDTFSQVLSAIRLELETKVHPKVRNHGEGPY